MPDAVVIQCPQCSKKFKLPANPPAVFNCTACGTAMDLSAFRAAPAAATAPPAAPAARAEPESKSAAPRSSRSSRAAGSKSPARLTARVRRGRADAGDEGEEGEEGAGGRFSRPPKNNNALIIVSVFGLVVIGGIVLLMSKKKNADDSAGSKSAAAAPVAAPTPPPVEAPMEDAMAEPAKPEVKKGSFHPVGHHPDATAEEQAKIDALVQTAVFDNAGSDSREAGKQLAAIGVKAAPRLINVFNTVHENKDKGFDSPEGRILAGVADGILRKIDGYQERKRRMMTPIKATSDLKFAEGTARSWMMWWDNETWKKDPLKPWDPRVDGNDDAPMDGGMGGAAGGEKSGSGGPPDGGGK